MTTARPYEFTGIQLNKRWQVGAKHALYHRGGWWYNNLRRFPGALFDAAGYVLFETEADYRSSPYVRVTEETNVSGGISSMPGYIKVAT